LNYYVYYRVSPQRLDAVRAQVQDLFTEIHQKTGVHGRWMRRRDDPTTYMEVYEGVREDGKALAAFESLLEREGAKLGIPRKVERFISAETPA
jgi:hypothetical protein